MYFFNGVIYCYKAYDLLNIFMNIGRVSWGLRKTKICSISADNAIRPCQRTTT